jgi:hypothetical protein
VAPPGSRTPLSQSERADYAPRPPPGPSRPRAGGGRHLALGEGPAHPARPAFRGLRPNPQHTRVTRTFTISNDGTELLRLLKVRPDCGCTVAELADSVIAPGDSTTLRVAYRSGQDEGEQRKVVVMETNDPAEPRLDLLLLAYVTLDVEVSERILAFGPVHRGQTPVLTTTLKADPGVSFTVRPPVDGREYVVWTVTRDPETGPQAWKLEARLRPDAPFGRFDVRVEVPLDHPKKKADRISIRGFIHSYFSPADPWISFGSLIAGRVLTKTMRLKADGPGDYLITGARVSVPWLKASLQRDGIDYLLSVTLDSKDPRRVNETVVLETTDPEQPELPVEIHATVR